MNIYRSSGRFAAVCAARSSTPSEQKSSDLPRNSPTPCSAIRERQVLNRTPISVSPIASSIPPISTSNCFSQQNSSNSIDEQMNDENSPIKSASYMDELRQRLERVLNDPTSNASNSSSLPERQPTLAISKSFRLPPPQTSSQLTNSSNLRSSLVSRVPTKPSNLRGPTLIVPPKVKPTTSISPCLNSTENLRLNNEPAQNPTMIGSTPLPRKQFQPTERNLSYRSSHQTYSLNSSATPQPQQQMSKSFIIPTKRDGKKKTLFLFSFSTNRCFVFQNIEALVHHPSLRKLIQ